MGLPERTQWQVYAALEEIPATVMALQENKAYVPPALTMAWRSLLNLFARELLYEQQIEFAERCFAASHLSPSLPQVNTLTSTLSKLKQLMVTVIIT